jgi:alanine racemase
MDREALMGETAWREISLSAIASNYRAVRAAVGGSTKIFACLKHDAYGCGAERAAAILAEEGVDAFGVVSLADAAAVRRGAPDRPILMYPGIGPWSVDLVQALDLTISISGKEDLEGWAATGRVLRAFVKLDIGLWRNGAAPSQIIRLLEICAAHGNLVVDGLYAHLSEFGVAGSSAVEQFARLTVLLGELARGGRLPGTVMISSSDSLLSYPEMDMDAIDPGALLFGLTGPHQGRRNISVRPALTALKARIIAIKQCDSSMGPPPALPGYRQDMRLAVLGIGWGQGLPRHLRPGMSALIKGRRVPIVPPAHLEHLRIDITGVPTAALGDEVLLLGSSGADGVTLAELAEAWGTDEVGVSCGLGANLRRVYVA